MLNLDQLAVEAGATPKPLVLGGTTFTLPAELPGSVLAPFLRPDLGLVDIISEVLLSAQGDRDGFGELLFSTLEKNPNLPAGLLKAGSDALEALLGDQYDDFLAKQPSVPAYMRLGQYLFETYGLTLGDSFSSSTSSGDEESSSKQTSPATTPAPLTETSEASSVPPAIPAPSDSDASES